MNKREFIDAYALKFGCTKTKAEEEVNRVLDFVVENSIEHGKLSLSGFGALEIVERKERKGRNPQTGEDIKIEAHKAVRFRPSSTFKNLLD